MTLKLMNSLGMQEQKFQSLEPDKVQMYHCGPTVKEPIHLGKFRSFLMADVLRRHLERSGYEVHQVMNITDVGHLNEFQEDFVEIAAARSGLYAWELVEKEEKKFHEERRALKILNAHEYPKAREHIDCMIGLAQDLEKKGVCYVSGGNLYLDVSKFSAFGKLSGKSITELKKLQESSRASVPRHKKHPLDIDLWRRDALHEMRWDSPWGRGFPGWHVECAAMSRKFLGGVFDIHTGADDNLFPHHECEIAQVEILTGKPLARYWLHTGLTRVEGKEMSRGNDNLVTVRELLEAGFRGIVLRVAILSSHYRSELNFDESTLDWARESVNLLLGFHGHLRERIASGDHPKGKTSSAWITDTDERFQNYLDSDLDYRAGLDVILDTLDRLEPADIGDPGKALKALESWDEVLGIL